MFRSEVCLEIRVEGRRKVRRSAGSFGIAVPIWIPIPQLLIFIGFVFLFAQWILGFAPFYFLAEAQRSGYGQCGLKMQKFSNPQ